MKLEYNSVIVRVHNNVRSSVFVSVDKRVSGRMFLFGCNAIITPILSSVHSPVKTPISEAVYNEIKI